MGITIGREQRDAIYQEVALDLTGLTDLWTEFNRGNFDRARELRTRFELDMRLLDNIGWEPEPEGAEFELTMDGVDLAAVVSYLIAQTGAILRTHIVEPIERTPHTVRSVQAQTAFGQLVGATAQRNWRAPAKVSGTIATPPVWVTIVMTCSPPGVDRERVGGQRDARRLGCGREARRNVRRRGALPAGRASRLR